MGRGTGEKSRFHKFIDESYFAFWFRQWAAVFIVIGVILIIVGAVVSQVIPTQKYQEFAQAQIVSSADDANYNNWVEKIEKVRYDFLDVDPETLTKSTKGPYIYFRALKKADVTFESSTVSYTLTVSRTFAESESAPPGAEISLINPTYAQWATAKGGELAFLVDEFPSDLATKMKTFYANEAYKFIASLGLAQKFGEVFTTVREDGIFPNIFSAAGLQKAVDNYKWRYASDTIATFPCPSCENTNQFGIKASLYRTFIEEESCRFGFTPPSDNNFADFFISGFDAATNAVPCGIFYIDHKPTSAVWAGADSSLVMAIMDSLDASKVRDWIHPVDPENLGYCGDRPDAVTHFGATADQIDDICDVLIPSFFPDITPSGETLELLGKKRLCMNTPPAGLSLVIPTTLPTGVSLVLEGKFMAAYDNSLCEKYLDALVDLDNFAIPVYDNPTLAYGTLLPAEVTRLYNYIHSLDATYKRWFTYLWMSDAAAYNAACSPCIFPAFSTHANAGLFNLTTDTSIHFMLFPEESPEGSGKSHRLRYALTNTNPRVEGGNLNLFSNVTAQASSGLLSWHYPGSFVPQIKSVPCYDLTDDQFDEVLSYVAGASNAYITSLGVGTNSDAGYLQFARAQLACGPNSSARCSIEQTFFGLTSPYYYEFGLASYVTTADPTYFESFDNTNMDARDDANAAGVFNLLTSIENDPAVVFALSEDDLTRRYFMFLLATYVRASLIPASSGIFAKRTALEWLTGYEDEAAAGYPEAGVSAEYAVDPDGSLLELTVETGASDILTAYLYKAVNGSGTVSAYLPADNIVGSYNYDGLPPTKVSPGATITFFDPLLMRNVKVTFAEATTDEAAGVTATKGTFAAADWNTGSHSITTKNLLPVPGVSGAYRSSCSIALPNSVSTFASTPGGTDDFPTESSIYADLNTGLVVRLETCLLFSASVSDQDYQITAPGLDQQNILFAQVMRRAVRQIGAAQADAYLAQYREVTDTATAILLALVIVGALFVLTGIIFIIFWFIRRNRKMSEKAGQDLVLDPFGEKKSNVGNMKY